MNRFSYVLLLALLIVVGCAGIQYQDQPQSANILNIDNSRAKSRVLAIAEEWRNSGVIVEKGKTYAINAKGSWTAGASCAWTNPDGLGARSLLCPDIGKIVKSSSIGTLIGRINENGTPFAIGNDLILSPHETGTLYYRINDVPGGCGDNDGYVDVEITLADVEKDHLAKTETRPSAIESDSRYGSKKDVRQQQYVHGQKWAVVMGISEYKDTRIPSLRYASADAYSFYQWLISPEGGRYAPQRVLFLVDAEATGERMKSALFEWLKQALAEDMVTIFFAGHGSPESPDNPSNLFLLPYDAKYDNIPSTGFPMWDIETALKRYIRAKKVVVIADACHAAGVGQPFDVARRANRALMVNPISSSLGELSMASDGVAIFSASADNQYSQEGQEWGGGHGVFTHFLLEGLKGGADFNKDGKVNLGELNLYLSEQVRRATKNAQSPIVSGKFDPALSIGR